MEPFLRLVSHIAEKGPSLPQLAILLTNMKISSILHDEHAAKVTESAVKIYNLVHGLFFHMHVQKLNRFSYNKKTAKTSPQKPAEMGIYICIPFHKCK